MYASASQCEPEKDTSARSQTVTITIGQVDDHIFKKYTPAQLSSMSFERFKEVVEQEAIATKKGRDFLNHIIKPNVTNRLKHVIFLKSLHKAAQNIEVKQFAAALGGGKEDADPKGELARAYLLKGIRFFQSGGEEPMKLSTIKFQ